MAGSGPVTAFCIKEGHRSDEGWDCGCHRRLLLPGTAQGGEPARGGAQLHFRGRWPGVDGRLGGSRVWPHPSFPQERVWPPAGYTPTWAGKWSPPF
ncbi:hypothetical protein GCM10010430_67540 [Kitasatospora cystarginea]|uniref:Uncharacterized protein n=1 Tax=Kitasatospora cystarginea TaxID=58350 RepID=A0ABN3EUS9_9ACTN